ncbi:hypothetical protein BRADI_2g41922v3 [Brachypodium distachyon]|uniref:Uncharacterized protein n=1 Tax=Brachypodium distachyon TaxID=15368 RepID=A0A2K2DDA9_BRADI|nr:hypothetical protein BRADI_2g41922v3 [Brachypodium distachyon]PNT72260.1 hypothetical protein BRADI_2g41922v3 [Brachypodium distachyon]PNT72261.1 hypothetical protein BRADI_2g41922v3 [Brachypodium distachyon]PNT72262.1 hypothetical protein BRADI_2g41922v3 [Brachypodium distachyon]
MRLLQQPCDLPAASTGQDVVEITFRPNNYCCYRCCFATNLNLTAVYHAAHEMIWFLVDLILCCTEVSHGESVMI